MTVSPYDTDILGSDAIADPYACFGELRERDPVFWDERYRSWLVTSHEHVASAIKDPRFSSDRIRPFVANKLTQPGTDPQLRRAFEVLQDWMVFLDDPEHARLRKLAHIAFTPKAVALMREHVDRTCRRLLADIARNDEIDLIAEFAFPLPAIVIAEMLGVPVEDRDKFGVWSEEIAPMVSASLRNPDRYTRAAVGMTELADYFEWLMARYEKEPADNLMSALIRAREDKNALSGEEIVSTCTLLLFGGHETTANLIANSILALLRHPDQLEALRAGRVEIGDAVEEFLRYDGPGKAVVRVLAEDVELGGKHMRAGQRVFLILASANHDPAAFDDPDALRLDRKSSRHLAFGFGGHYCLGAPLARLEATVALPLILERFPHMELTGEPLHWQPVLLTRGLEALPLRVTHG